MKKILCFFLCALLVFALASCTPLPNARDGVETEFIIDDLKITLTDSFEPSKADGHSGCYSANDVMVIFDKETVESLEDTDIETLSDYVNAILEKTEDLNVSEITDVGNITYIEYTNETEDDKYSFFVSFYKSEDAFWMLQFSSRESDYADYRPDFVKWAKSVSFEQGEE